MVVVLNDPEFKLGWPSHAEYIQELQSVMSRGPEQGAQVREALQAEYPEYAASLYRMLCDYTEKDLRGTAPDGKDGDAIALIDLLDSESLAVRVLASSNLNRLFQMNLYYEADATAAKRRASIQRWRQRWQSGEIWTKLAPTKPRADEAQSGSVGPDEAGS
jgi:hypothetical protein